MNKILIIFARKPELGKVKTRLAKDVGDKKALSIYTQLLTQTRAIAIKVDAELKLYWTGEIDSDNDYYQKGNDLGERMYNALVSETTNGKICLIGTDTPTLTPEIVENAFIALENFDIVFGPSVDGGYYLVASNAAAPKELFINKTWSHNQVLEDALKVCNKLNLSVKLMPALLDIDTIDDYNEWQSIKE